MRRSRATATQSITAQAMAAIRQRASSIAACWRRLKRPERQAGALTDGPYVIRGMRSTRRGEPRAQLPAEPEPVPEPGVAHSQHGRSRIRFGIGIGFGL